MKGREDHIDATATAAAGAGTVIYKIARIGTGSAAHVRLNGAGDRGHIQDQRTPRAATATAISFRLCRIGISRVQRGQPGGPQSALRPR